MENLMHTDSFRRNLPIIQAQLCALLNYFLAPRCAEASFTTYPLIQAHY